MQQNYLINGFFLFSIMLFSCREKVIDIEENTINKITFENLPSDVIAYLDANIDSIDKSDNEFYYSTDPNIEFTYGRSGVADTWLDEVNSNYHHFFIDGVHYRLRGNKGHPFIYHEGYLFFCDLNLYEEDYKTRPYFMVKIP